VVTFVEMMLLSLDNGFLIGSLTIPKSFPYNTGSFSAILVTGTIFLSSTGAERHLKTNGFVTSSDPFLISTQVLSSSAHLEVVNVSHASWNEMASHFEDPLDHTDLPLFSRYFTCIHMVIFLVALAVSAACARFCSFIVARLWRTMVTRGLILATEVAFVVMVHVMAALSVCPRRLLGH